MCLLWIYHWRPDSTLCSLLKQSQSAYSYCLIHCLGDAHLWCVLMPLTDWRNWDQTGSTGNKKKTNVRLHSAQLCLWRQVIWNVCCSHFSVIKAGQNTNSGVVPQPLQTPSECHFHTLLLYQTWTTVRNMYTDLKYKNVQNTKNVYTVKKRQTLNLC